MCRSKTRSCIAPLLFFFLLASAQSFGESYLITGSEMTQIKTELQSLRLELSILKANSLEDAKALQTLSAKVEKLQTSLNATEADLTSVQAQLAEARTALDELKASLNKSKRAALWLNIKVGGICLGVGASIGVVIGIAISK